MKSLNHLSVSLFLAILLAACSADQDMQMLSVIPAPQEVKLKTGVFAAGPETRIVLERGQDISASLPEMLDAYFEPLLSSSPEVICSENIETGAINLGLCPSLPKEGYMLKISPSSIVLKGGSNAGLFYGLQTLFQMFSTGRKGLTVAAAEISDYPVFPYRGFMLDAARHFFTVDEVKEMLDIMAFHKLNVFHWHLTDDQGWRIEIHSYPELTRIGAFRKRTLVGKDPGGHYDEHTLFDERPYGGFYSQEEIREVVAYAAERNITVIPEIEFPGHAVAALASCPWLSCTGEQYEVRQTWDIDDRTFCIGKESTFTFMENVLEEVMELFPSGYIHIGGDECPVKMWKNCPDCAVRMREENIGTERGLQGYALRRIGKFVEEHGRHLIGWDEILEAGIDQETVVMSWRGTEGGIRAARMGNRVIMSPTSHCYFDYYQSEETEKEPLAWGGYLPVGQVYSFNPVEGLDEEQASHVLGVQANLWTEYIADLWQAEYMMLPRLAALSEVAWSSEHDYPDFMTRLSCMQRLYEAADWNFRRLK